MRKKLFEIIEPSDGKNIISSVYDCLIILAIVASIIPPAFKTSNSFFVLIDKITLALLIFDAVYWATISLTTVGYGDIYPVSTTGRIFTMISSVFGIAIIALPSGVITAAYLDEIHKIDKDDK